jgi:hypothetical protein
LAAALFGSSFLPLIGSGISRWPSTRFFDFFAGALSGRYTAALPLFWIYFFLTCFWHVPPELFHRGCQKPRGSLRPIGNDIQKRRESHWMRMDSFGSEAEEAEIDCG